VEQRATSTVNQKRNTETEERKKRTSYVVWADTSWQHAFRWKSELVPIRLRIERMIIKVHVQHAHGGVNGGPRHNKRLAVDALAHNIERLARAADTWAAAPSSS